MCFHATFDVAALRLLRERLRCHALRYSTPHGAHRTCCGPRFGENSAPQSSQFPRDIAHDSGIILKRTPHREPASSFHARTLVLTSLCISQAVSHESITVVVRKPRCAPPVRFLEDATEVVFTDSFTRAVRR